MLDRGARAPDFSLPADDGSTVTLSAELADLSGDAPLILYFYPADFTPGCTAEACAIRDIHDELAEAGIVVLGVSPQSAGTHEKFREKHRLPYRLIADPDKVAIRAYGVDGPLGMGVRRVTYAIRKDGTIDDLVKADIRIGRHTDFVQSVLAKARRAEGS